METNKKQSTNKTSSKKTALSKQSKKGVKERSNKLSTFQVCNKLKLHKYYKAHVEKKYKGFVLEEDKWIHLLKKDGLDL